MPLPASGVIKSSDIRDEYYGSNPIRLGDFYSNGEYVGVNQTGIPSSGEISLSDFYGKNSDFLTTVTIGHQDADPDDYYGYTTIPLVGLGAGSISTDVVYGNKILGLFQTISSPHFQLQIEGSHTKEGLFTSITPEGGTLLNVADSTFGVNTIGTVYSHWRWFVSITEWLTNVGSDKTVLFK